MDTLNLPISNPPIGELYSFGKSIAIDGNWMAIGDPDAYVVAGYGGPEDKGIVFLYERVGSDWIYWGRITFPDYGIQTPYFQSNFGWAVDIHENRLVIGAPEYFTYVTTYNPTRNSGGRIYIYDYDEVENSWKGFNQEFLYPMSTYPGHEGLEYHSRFGASVAVEGDLIAVGAPNQGIGALFGNPALYPLEGAVFLYEPDIFNPGFLKLADIELNGTQDLQNIYPGMLTFGLSDPDENDHLGTSVALSGNWVIMGAPAGDGGDPEFSTGDDEGVAFLFQFVDDGSWEEYEFKERVFDPLGQNGEQFGFDVDIQEFSNTIRAAIGAPNSPYNPVANTGKVFTRYYNSVEDNWLSSGILIRTNPAGPVQATNPDLIKTGDGFGTSVSIDEAGYLLVGSPGSQIGGDKGAAWIYTLGAEVDDWQSTPAICITPPHTIGTDDGFGTEVALDGNNMAFGIDTYLDYPRVAFASTLSWAHCQGDLDGDGDVDGGDLGLFNSRWGLPGPTDLNKDGTTDGADLGLFLTFWGPCP
ncbi:MAG: FG-GAP repeat protein [Phycisphaerales bacterium JB043]